MPDKTIRFKSDALLEKSLGLRFDLPQLGPHASGFVVRYNNKAYAYVNQCQHVPVELDWNEGQFFTATQDYLICATHGAQYEPDTGKCVYGPCVGRNLTSLPVTEQDGEIIIHIDSVAGLENNNV